MAKKPGLAPGTVIHTGRKKVDKVTIDVLDYDESSLEEKKLNTVKECLPFKKKPTVSWLNINGLHDTQLIEELGKDFNLHSLVLEDIVNVDQRPKLEDFDEYIYVVLKMVSYDPDTAEISFEQISIILGDNYVISFQERPGDIFDPVRKRIRDSKGKIRKKGSDYLAYALIDSIVDNYYVLLEDIGVTIEDLDAEIIENPIPKTLKKIHKLKRELSALRKSILPIREVIHNMQRGDSQLISETTDVYLRDVYDHTIQVIDNIETLRDTVSGMLDVYLSSISNKMNEVMKVLTVIATIFIPLTFVAGMYGMNFEFMPELKVWWAYPLIWIVVISIAISMFIYFRRKGWL